MISQQGWEEKRVNGVLHCRHCAWGLGGVRVWVRVCVCVCVSVLLGCDLAGRSQTLQGKDSKEVLAQPELAVLTEDTGPGGLTKAGTGTGRERPGGTPRPSYPSFSSPGLQLMGQRCSLVVKWGYSLCIGEHSHLRLRLFGCARGGVQLSPPPSGSFPALSHPLAIVAI